MSKIFWTQRECQIVAARYLALRAEGFTKLGAIKQAQQSLPPARRKTDLSLGNLLYEKTQRSNNGLWFYINNPEQIASPPDEPPAVTVSDPVRPEPEGGAAKPDVLLAGMSAAIHALAYGIAGTLRTKLEIELERELGKLESELMARLAETGALVSMAACDKDKAAALPRVLIVSLRGQQGPEIRKEFEGLLRVQWVESGTHDAAISALRNFPGHVICMARFISHSDEAHFKKHPRHRTIHGGMSELREALLEIAAKDEVQS